MKTFFFFAGLFCIGCNSTSSLFDPDGVGNLSLHVGQKSLREADWGPSADTMFAGVSVDWTPPNALYGFELAVLPSLGENANASGATTASLVVNEYAAGLFIPIRTGWGETILRVGAGLALLDFGYQELTAIGSVNRHGSTEIGFYTHAGILIPFADRWHMGLDLRLGSTEDPDFGLGSGDFSQVTLVLAYRF